MELPQLFRQMKKNWQKEIAHIQDDALDGKLPTDDLHYAFGRAVGRVTQLKSCIRDLDDLVNKLDPEDDEEETDGELQPIG